MHQPKFIVRAAGAVTALFLALSAQAQTTLPAPMPAPAPAPAAAPVPTASGDQNTPAPVARQQQAEISRGDPARWHQEDATMQARMRTLRKEIAAGLQENLGACRSQPAAERSACMREARSIYQQEMANLGRTAGMR